MQSNTMMSAKLLDTINEYKPDAIIMCHPFVTTMVSKLRRQHKIDTYDISIEPYEDCCTVFTPKHPRTRPVSYTHLDVYKRQA